MTKIKKNKLMVFLVLIFVMFSFIGTINITYCAETSDSTSVLADLQKDSEFNVDDYPIVEMDYSLEVISIAESSSKELYVYVYHPARRFNATSINIATTDEKNYKVYELEMMSKENALYKYKVKDFVVSDDSLRYYDISAIFRKYNVFVDRGVYDNRLTEISYPVGKLYTAQTKDDVVTYNCITTETITITDKYVGFVRYGEHFSAIGACDAHYVAFSTDKEIDFLIEAELYYVKKSYRTRETLLGSSTTYGDAVSCYSVLHYTEEASGDGFISAKRYKWDRISSASDFVASDDYELTSSAKSNISNKDWVLSFCETQYDKNVYWSEAIIEGTAVTDVTILRLKFETDGVVYNLGVVDNRQEGDLLPDNEQPKIGNWWNDLLRILMIVGIVILTILLLPVIIPFLGVFFKGLYYILKYVSIGIYYALKYIFVGLAWLVMLPFKFFRRDE